MVNKITVRVFLLTVLSVMFCDTNVLAATLNLVTKYGATGGLAGNFNQVGDQVNGRQICPQVNDYNNNAPGCDMSGDAGFQEGPTVAPDDDYYTGDLIVRTNDSFELIAAWSWLGNAGGNEEQVTLTGTLPSGTGFIWDGIPGSCNAALSELSADRKVITCVRKDFDTNDVGSYAEDFVFAVKVEGNAVNGSVPGDITITIDDPTGSGPVTDGVRDGNDANLLKVTAAPRWNIDMHGGPGYYTTRYGAEDDSGQPGWELWYNFTVEVDEVDGETDSAINPALGNEALKGGSDATVNFQVDLNTISPNAKLVTWSSNTSFSPVSNACDMDTYTNSDEPYPALNVSHPERSIPVAAGEMGVTCDQAANQVVSVEVTGIDGTLTDAPVRNRNGGALPVNRKIAAIGLMRVFVPLSDVQDAGGTLTTRNCITNFDPVGISGGANFGGARESETDNCREITLYASAGWWDKNFRRGWSDQEDQRTQWGGGSWSLPPTDASVVEAGDGYVTPGSVWGTYTVYQNSGGTDIDNPVLCDVIDVETYKMTILDPETDNPATFVDDTKHAVDLNYGSTENVPGLTIEYATGYVGAWPPDPNEPPGANAPDEVVRECDDPGITWYPDMATAEASDGRPVSKVRISAPSLPAGGTMAMRIRHTARSHFLSSGQPIPNNTILVNHATYKSSLTGGIYRAGDYFPRDAAQSPGNGSGGGDRLIMTGGKVRIVKEMAPTSLSPGGEATVTLSPSFTTDSLNSRTDNVTVADLLPKGLSYVHGSTSGTYGTESTPYGEPAIYPANESNCLEYAGDIVSEGFPCGPLNGGTGEESILVWDLGDLETGTVFHSLEFQTLVAIDAPAGTLHNYAQITSPADSSVSSKRVANANVNNTVPSSLLIVKRVLTPTHEINSGDALNWMEFEVGLRNGSSGELTELDVIDILPFNGDGNSGSFTFTPQVGTTVNRNREPATNFAGMLRFDSMSFDENNGQCNGDAVEYWFTNAAGPLDISPLHSSNAIPGGSAGWCQGSATGPGEECGFDIADVTAVRLRGVTMDPSGTCFFNLKYATADNAHNNVYSNTAGAKAVGVTNAVLSNTVSAFVYSGSIGNRVWVDTNGNGIQDSGENGIAGAVVRLCSPDGSAPPVDPATGQPYEVTTGADGSYLFTSLLAGDYRVCFSLPPIDPAHPVVYGFTTADSGNDDELDSDVSAGGRVDVTLGSAENNLTIDAGLVEIQPVPAIDIEKLTNGQDADSGYGPQITIGDPVEWTYVVTNTGNVELTGITVTDSQGIAVSCPGTTLAPGESMTCSASGTAEAGRYESSASVTGIPPQGIDGSPHDVDFTHHYGNPPFPWLMYTHLVQPRCPGQPDYCYLVADGDNEGSTNSALFSYNFASGSYQMLGRLGVGNVEAITLSLDGKTLYGADNGVLGIIDPTPGLTNSFIPVNTDGIGSGSGDLGVIEFNDIDGMSFDPVTGRLFASVRIADGEASQSDLLIQIDPATGRYIENGFGPGKDYIVIDTRGLSVFDIDDIAIDTNGTIYGVAGNSGGGGQDRLVIIDRQTGRVRDQGALANGDHPIQDVEGLTLFSLNSLYGVSGFEFSAAGTSATLFRINKNTGESTPVTNLAQDFNGYIPDDFEAITCYPICK